MKVSQKALALLLSASMVISSFAGTAAFASEAGIGNVGDRFDSGNYTFEITNNAPDSAVKLEAIKTPTVDNTYSIPDEAWSAVSHYQYQVKSVAENVFLSNKALKITYKDYTVQNFGDVPESGSVGLYTSADGSAVYAEAYPNIEGGYVFANWADASGNVITPPNPLEPNPYKFTNAVKTVYAVFEKGTPQPAKKTISAFLNVPKGGWSISVKVGTNSIPFPDITVRYTDDTTGTLQNVKWFCTTGSDWNKVGHYVFQPDLIGYKLASGLLPPKCSVAVETNTANLVTGVSLPASITYSGDFTAQPTHQLHATVRPADATDQKVTWKSSDPSVATIDANGLMTLKGYGTTTITVATEDGFFTAFCTVIVQSQDNYNQEIDALKNVVDSLPNAASATMDNTTKSQIQTAVTVVQLLGEDAASKIGSAQIDNLEALLEKLTTANGAVSKQVAVEHDPSIIKDSAISEVPTVSGLLLAAGITGGESTATPVNLQMNQTVPTDSSAVLAFEMNLTVGSDEIHDLRIPVTITFKLPDSFHYDSSRTYSIQHFKDDGDTETLPLTINGRYASFTTSSFSTFMLTSTANGSSPGGSDSHSSGSHSASSISSDHSPAVTTFVSDTTADFAVNSEYEFKITSFNGAAPVLTVGTSGVFETQLVKTSSNEYYFKLIAIGAPGAKAGIYVNGVKLLVATVGTAVSSVRCDTTKPFVLKSGASYVIKLTAPSKPTLTSGSSSAFRVSAVGSKGNDYFFKVTAVGKVGSSTGFYLNGEKTPRTVATITK